jgi:hypothetical protein
MLGSSSLFHWFPSHEGNGRTLSISKARKKSQQKKEAEPAKKKPKRVICTKSDPNHSNNRPNATDQQ